MTKTKLKALSAILVIAVLLLTIFVANYAFVQHAYAEEFNGSDDDSGYTLPEDENEGIDILAGLLDNMMIVIIVAVVFAFVIFPLIILGIVVSAMRNRR